MKSITRIGSYDELFQDAFRVRGKVFVDETGESYDFEDEFDNSATHIVLFDESEPIATARLIFKDKQYQIGRVAVMQEYRGQKLGRMVMQELLQFAKTKNIEEIHIHSQCHAQSFYEKLGFVPYGEIFEEANIPHIAMIWRNENNA